MEDDCPLCFRGVHLRGGDKYQDLRLHAFSFIEKLLLCERIRRIPSGGLRKMACRYNLRKSAIKTWLREYRLGTMSDSEYGTTVTELRMYQLLAENLD
jgi:hypothetical protein